MNSRTHPFRRLCALAAGLAVVLFVVPLHAQTPATQPGRTDEQIMADLRVAIPELGPIVGSAARLSDPAVRQAVAPKAIPLLQRILADIDQISAIPEAAKMQARLQYLPLL